MKHHKYAIAFTMVSQIPWYRKSLVQRLVPLAFRHGLRQVASTTTLGLPKHLASYRISHVPAIDWLLAVKVQSREWLPTVHVQPLSRE